ncbi:hypothetical protein QSJ19_19735 [Gordonia sp. ABSL11-1]|uniref:hypothetical protein n=1 Tax=Gordonia sp. ABSL11-1 TaxID=3053924 RepID=UPI0025738645|nr:hypothetical protein [Gordonia sp. ABSL11-1]MDL9947769.1 hypothetical protein [Gordonia sp. ABSL11-1]
MPQVMPLRDARARAERVFYLRSVAGLSWSAIRDECGYTSNGGAQRAYKRYLDRNPVPDGDTVLAEIIERKRVTTGVATKALARAVSSQDWSAAASLLRTINAQDNELAKLYGLHAPERHQHQVAVATADRFDQLERELLATIDGQVIE